MPSSWTQNYYHAVFSTKGREPLITTELEPRLHAFLGGILKELRCTPIAINGMSDHVHLLARYPSDLSHADMLRHVKSRSSAWVHETFPAAHDFAWQDGYGGFTVSQPSVPAVTHYVQNQKEHHRTLTFVEEFMEMLRRAGVEASERDVFA
jgi:putative transposase